MQLKRQPGMESEFDPASAAAYNRISGLPVFHIERRLVMRELRRFNLRGTLLDVGCGPGHLILNILRSFPSLKIIGLDISPDMLGLAAQNLPPGKAELVLGDVQALPMADASVDFVLSSASLHHWADAAKGFQEIYRVLSPGGRFLIMDLRRSLPLPIYVGARILSLFAPAELKRTNGVLGSLYTSYTPGELEAILAPLFFREWRVKTGLAWIFIEGRR